MRRDRPGADAFEEGLFLPARQVVSFPDILNGYTTSEALQPYLTEDVHRHVDEDRHLLDEEAMRLDVEGWSATSSVTTRPGGRRRCWR